MFWSEICVGSYYAPAQPIAGPSVPAPQPSFSYSTQALHAGDHSKADLLTGIKVSPAVHFTAPFSPIRPRVWRVK